jgi:hypothetical protein
MVYRHHCLWQLIWFQISWHNTGTEDFSLNTIQCLAKKTNLETYPASASFEIFTVVQLRNPFYWDIMLRQWVIRYRPHLQGSKCLGLCKDLITHWCTITSQNRTLDLCLFLRRMELTDTWLRKATTFTSMLNDAGWYHMPLEELKVALHCKLAARSGK